jgi:hypothetical protein
MGSRAVRLACSASFGVAIVDSIGDSNRNYITNPGTDTLHLAPRFLSMTSTEIDAMRLSLTKKLTSMSDLPSHRGFMTCISRLVTAGQSTLPSTQLSSLTTLPLNIITPFPWLSSIQSIPVPRGQCFLSLPYLFCPSPCPHP